MKFFNCKKIKHLLQKCLLALLYFLLLKRCPRAHFLLDTVMLLVVSNVIPHLLKKLNVNAIAFFKVLDIQGNDSMYSSRTLHQPTYPKNDFQNFHDHVTSNIWIPLDYYVWGSNERLIRGLQQSLGFTEGCHCGHDDQSEPKKPPDNVVISISKVVLRLFSKLKMVLLNNLFLFY